MRILQVVADGNPGGGTTFVLDLLKTLSAPTLLTQKNSYALEKGGDIPKFGLDFFTSRIDPRIAIEMGKILRKVQPDLIHVHGGRAAFFLSFCTPHCPIIYTVHGLHGLYQKRFFSRFAERRAMKKASLITFVSHTEKKVAAQSGLLQNRPHCVIPHGIDASALMPNRKRKPKLIGFMGRLCPQKDPLFLLEVMEILGPKGYHLRVIGGGELEEAMRNSRFTTVTGKVSRKEGLQLLSEVESIIVPSKWEAFGLVLLEAMALEIPIIAARIPPFEEVFAEQRLATLIETKDPQRYAQAVVNGADYSQEAKEYLLRNFSWEKCSARYHSIFRELKESPCYPSG